MADLARDLFRACIDARASGADFPTIWREVLRNNVLVAGEPVQGRDVADPSLEVRLMTGQTLVFRAAEITLE
jgi:hypothetical protein